MINLKIKKQNLRISIIAFLFSVAGNSVFANQEILSKYAAEAKKEDSAFTDFSAEKGKELYFLQRTNSKSEKVSCTTCHTENPKANGRTRANKDIDPLAPIANPKRFTDLSKVEKWFTRNCKDVLERSCSAIEKGNFVKYMMTIK